MGGYYGFDATYILVLIGALISIIASANVNGTFKKYSKIRNARGLTGRECAAMILESAGIYDVTITRVSGNLTDHYAPNEKTLRLSDSVYDSTSVAALGVAAHECGHAIQDKEQYAPLKLRAASVPMANIGSKLSIPVIILGLALGWAGLAQIGVILFVLVVFFQVITLPVEFDASHRALAILEGKGILGATEMNGARKVLKAAAMTYVAAVISSVLQLVRLILLTRGRSRD